MTVRRRVFGTGLVATRRSVRATDSRAVRDDVLHAVDPGKVAELGRIWDGLQQRIDKVRAAVSAQLDTPLRAGRVLHAEQLDQLVDLGRTWSGHLDQLERRDFSEHEDDGRADALARARELSPEADYARRHSHDGSPTGRMIAASRDAIASVQRQNEAARASGLWSGNTPRHAALPADRSATVQEHNAATNAANRAFWRQSPR